MSRSINKRNLKALEQLAQKQGISKKYLPPIKITTDQVAALTNGESIKIYGLPLYAEDFISLDNLEQVTDSRTLMGVLTETKLRKWAKKEFE